MNIVIVHLSDIHIFDEEEKNPVLSRSDQIAAAVTSVAPISANWFVIISGDLASSGKSSEYVFVGRFLHQLNDQILARLQDASINFIFVPGNHDCDFSQQHNVRQILLQQIAEDDFDDTVYSTFLEAQTDFLSFEKLFFSRKEDEIISSRVFRTEEFILGKYSIKFQLLNTSLMSSPKEKQGKLLFPTKLIDSYQNKSHQSYVISVMHHPYSWLEATNSRRLREKIEASSDLILTGHEHEGDHYRKERFSGERTEYIEGGILQNLKDTYSSSFSVLTIDLEGSTQYVHNFTWDKDGIYKQGGERISVPLQRNSYRLRSEFKHSEDFMDYLTDAEAKFTHPEKESVTLDDIFVYPDLRRLYLPGKKKWEPKIIRDDVPLFIYNNHHVLIEGPEKCGKTALAKSLYKDLGKFSVLPMLIKGDKIKKTNEEYILNLIEESYDEQYQTPEFDYFQQTDIPNKAIIIDNFHKIPTNARGRERVIKFLTTYFGIVVLISNGQLKYDELISRSTEDLEIWRFTHCEILAFGHLRRSDLIEKWTYLGRSLTQSRAELSQRIAQTEKILTELLGSNIVPPYPLFVLVILQQIEAKTPLDATSSSGSYGYIYEALLTMALSRVSRLGVDIDTQYNYLSELAYHLYTLRNNSISLDKLEDWHDNYCNTYSINLNSNEILENFKEATVLRVDDYAISFCYPYLYYYFTARYFRDHMGEVNIRECISEMSQRLHHNESANIILFLSYLTKDPFILSSILDSSRDLFASYQEFNLEFHVNFLSTLVSTLPEYVIDSSEPDERRREMLTRRDELHEDQIEDEIEGIALDNIDLDRDLDELLQINVAFKTIQILGQILRNFLGSLEGGLKQELAREAYSLGLRVLSFMFQMVESEQSEIIDALIEIVRFRHPKWSDERLIKEVESFIFNLLEGLTFVIIKQVSDSVGDERLTITLNQLSQMADNISYRFIDLSIRLDYYRGFPKNEILDLYKEVYNNQFSSHVIRHLAWYHFYLYPTNYATRQSICDRLEIKLQPYVVYDSRPKLIKG